MMPQRKLNRLHGYNYSTPGSYFVTICAHQRFEDRNIFGHIHEGVMEKNYRAEIVEDCWQGLPDHYSHVIPDEFVVMPDHIHGIIWITDMAVGNGFKPFPTGKPNHGLPEIIRGLKTFSSRRINKLNDKNNFQWQKSYYDHIIRNDESLHKIREYIRNNPTKWELDHDHNEEREITRIVGNGFKPFRNKMKRDIL